LKLALRPEAHVCDNDEERVSSPLLGFQYRKLTKTPDLSRLATIDDYSNNSEL